MAKTPKADAIHNIAPPPAPKLARKLRPKAVAEPPVDRVAELRLLVRQHKFLTGFSVRTRAAVSDHTDHETGKTIPTLAPAAIQLDANAAADSAKAAAHAMEGQMLKLLKGIPIYDSFLSLVPGMRGPVTCAYLVTMVDIRRADTVSKLIRYCGFGTGPDGKSERRSGAPQYAPDGKLTGGPGSYNEALKIVLVVAFLMMRQSCSKQRGSHKYLRRWDEAKHGSLTLDVERIEAAKKSIKSFAEAKGRRKATDLFLWDLYVVWRTLEGLPIRPDKYSAVRGHYHTGQEARDAWYSLTLDEALAMVGPIVATEAAEAAQ